MNKEHTLTPEYPVEDVDAFCTQVKKDICFLKDRIFRLQQQRKLNLAVVDAYQAMITTREVVLGRLQAL